ncbi:MAG: IS1380 family transposase [Actinomycetota bacterium]
MQGASAPLRLRHSAGELTDGGGLLLIRRTWDLLGIGAWLDRHTRELPGRFRPSLMVEVWVVLLLYGGGWMDDLKRLGRRGIRRLFGWKAVPDPTTFGRWLRRSSAALVPLLDALLWELVLRRWQATGGTPKRLTLLLDSTVVVRYGLKQAGAEKGYNPDRPGRRSHHPLLAFTAETGDCLGVIWRGGSAHTAEGAIAWIRQLIARLRSAGVEQITLRLDKGFFSKAMVEALEELGVSYFLKVPDWRWVRAELGATRRSTKDPRMWTRSGTLYGARLLSVERRSRSVDALGLETFEVGKPAHILTNVEGIRAVSAWRRYNAGAVVEDRIKELGELGLGRTAVDDRGANHLLWSLGVLTYQLLHWVRTTALQGSWRRAQPERLRNWLLRLPAKLTSHARKHYVQLQRTEPLRSDFLRALRVLERLRAPPLPS